VSKAQVSIHHKAQSDHYANQRNPNTDTHKEAEDNRANQLNPNNDKYWRVRGLDRPSAECIKLESGKEKGDYNGN